MLKGKPNWITRQEEDLQTENARRITRMLTGKLMPDREYIIDKMRRRYSKYGKRDDRHM